MGTVGHLGANPAQTENSERFSVELGPGIGSALPFPIFHRGIRLANWASRAKQMGHRQFRGCDGVIHLAAYLGVRRTEVNSLRCLEININGTKKVLQKR